MTIKNESISSSTGEPTQDELEQRFDQLLAQAIEAQRTVKKKIEELGTLARQIGRTLPMPLFEGLHKGAQGGDGQRR
jgi:hypothetical protein